jgi:hypothetical protein
MGVVQGEDTLAALIAACHRALDDLRRLDTTKLVCGGVSGRGRTEGLLYRWRSTDSEPRCYVVRVADGDAD